MTHYRNLNGSLGVFAFETSNDFINVQFNTGSGYRYSYRKAGSYHVEQMKLLAYSGSGLNSYINRFVKFLYD